MSLIEAHDVWKEFAQPGQNVVALRSIDLEVASGEFLAVTGESGSGKSTLLTLLGALDRPTRGTIRLLGQTLSEASASSLARLRCERIGFVFQDSLLVRHLSALDNVRLPLLFSDADDTGELAAELLRRVGLEHRLSHRPQALSRGELQRAALARALVNRPQVLLADEPSANLDRRNSESVWRILSELNSEDGLTVIVATHNAEMLRHASRVVRLDDGRMEANDAQ